MADGPRELAKQAVERYWQLHRTTVTLNVVGQSMGGSIPDGSRITVQFGTNCALQNGTVMYFRRGRKRIVHRLRFAIGPICIEKGDARRLPGICMRSSILGVVLDIKLPRHDGSVQLRNTCEPEELHMPSKAKS